MQCNPNQTRTANRLTSAYRRLTLIASNENIAARDRIDAEAASCEVALAIAKLAFKGPIVQRISQPTRVDPGSDRIESPSRKTPLQIYV
jgi:hypothetical protein